MTPGLDSAHLVVRSSAGTGKTWLLTSRIVRLLLEGASPGSILAITFTRKAAAEIRQRVLERLRRLLETEDQALPGELLALGMPPHPETLDRARRLYELVLTAEHPLRATTFHAFCQELLRRFAQEAGVSPGFELLELTEPLLAQARAELEAEVTRRPDSPLARAVDTLLVACDGLDNTYQALEAFWTHRSDWWSYTEDQADPVAHAGARLRETLQISPAHSFGAFGDQGMATHLLQRYLALFARAPLTATQTTALERVAAAVVPGVSAEERYRLATPAFLTNQGTARAFKLSKAAIGAIGGEATAQELAAVQERIVAALLTAREGERRRATFDASLAWFTCGQRLLDHYQRLKQERHQLDFADLEWKAYRLLNASRHAEWVQYKLDQRIDHLLVDEFQDTNPTQWRLLLPLLSEIAAGTVDRRRSIFVVGDEKQSIYRFRRADARLLAGAQRWLTENLDADCLTQHTSWRSSPAIIRFVNLLFAGQAWLADFPSHETHRGGYWGAVEVLPLVSDTSTGTIPPATLRNPLLEPRMTAEDTRYQREAEMVAGRIEALVGHEAIEGEAGPRVAAYGDILVLLRDRRHAHHYEAALRRDAIPYVGADRGRFTRRLEVRDLLQLLRIFTMPYDDLALACVLKSPIFACGDTDLIALAGHARTRQFPSWLEALVDAGGIEQASAELLRARDCLAAWRQAADRVPVHDLLDRVYNEGDILARYRSAAPAHLKQRVEANLLRLLELALEIDSGRYPSLARFLSQVEAMTRGSEEPPGRNDEGGRVRVMTVHAAKGLEAPVVFLVDAASDARQERAWRPLIDWPIDSAQPLHFHLVGKKDEMDAVSARLAQQEERGQRQEEMNLLYVALTRAKQWLFVSGCAPRRAGKGTSWYALIAERVRANGSDTEGMQVLCAEETAFHCRLAHGQPPAERAKSPATLAAPRAVDPRLRVPLADTQAPGVRTVRPSEAAAAGAQEIAGDGETWKARRRGKAIHRALQLLTSLDRDMAQRSLQNELAHEHRAEEIEAVWRDALAVVESPAFARFFAPGQFQRALNEVPLLYRDGDREVYGVIDRLVLTEKRALILEYKTHAHANADNLDALAEAYKAQIRLYARGVKKLWPDHAVEARLLFTACGLSVNVPVD